MVGTRYLISYLSSALILMLGRRRLALSRGNTTSRRGLMALGMIVLVSLLFNQPCYAEESAPIVSVDINTVEGVMPSLYNPSIDLTGHGYPHPFADQQIIDYLNEDIALSGTYRIRVFFHLVDVGVHQKEDSLALIKKIQNQGGEVIVTLFGMPDRFSSCTTDCDYWNEEVKRNAVAPSNWQDWENLVYGMMKYLSVDNNCDNILYEVWNEPDLGYWQDTEANYFELYKYSCSAAQRIEADYGVQVKIGGPVVSQWNNDINGDPLLIDETSLKEGVVYRFIEYCHDEGLPIDFVAWHQYSTTNGLLSSYNVVPLTRNWLAEFGFNPETRLVLSEWNSSRESDGITRASYIPAFLREMETAGLDSHTFFCIQDYFVSLKEELSGDLGLLTLYGIKKPTYHVFTLFEKMKNAERVSVSGPDDPFVDAIAARNHQNSFIMLWNHPPLDVRRATTLFAEQRGITVESLAAMGIYPADIRAYVLQGIVPISFYTLDQETKDTLREIALYYHAAAERQVNAQDVEVTIGGLDDTKTYQCNIYTLDEYRANAFQFEDSIDEEMNGYKLDSFGDFLVQEGVPEWQKDILIQWMAEMTLDEMLPRLSEEEQEEFMRLYTEYSTLFDPDIFAQAKRINSEPGIALEPTQTVQIIQQATHTLQLNFKPYSVHFLEILEK